jgi:hypothetical protein
MKTLRNHFSFQEIRKNAGKPGRFYFFGGYQKKHPAEEARCRDDEKVG